VCVGAWVVGVGMDRPIPLCIMMEIHEGPSQGCSAVHSSRMQ
jgi:hypothetical protein